MKKVFLLITLCTLFYNGFSQDSKEEDLSIPNAYSPTVTKDFAIELFNDGFIEEAETEFRRYLFTANNKIPDENVIFNLATIYNMQNNKTGIIWLRNTFPNQIRPAIQEKIDLSYSRLLFLERDLSCFTDFSNSISKNLSSYSKNFQLIVPLSIDVLNKDFTKATEQAKTAKDFNAIFEPSYNLLAQYNTKNPYLAMGLSMIIPGSGKLYTGSVWEFASSFLGISSFVAGTIYTGIEYEWKNWRPYVFGSCALILYVVDVYGSYKSALRYNDAQNRKICESIDKIYEELY